ncbi:arrestin domain-containing protein 2-like [Tubulanus polymorphus]|uniref:arrestin domain-containing protein 2-like n=1 Tax=Tubulanus polymorphus TaxID=672921 RepID=UPI003DA35AD8
MSPPGLPLRLWLHGLADTSWRDMHGNSSRGCFEYQRCLHDCLTLFGQGKSNKPILLSMILKPGLHCYKFEYTLPKDIPTSFEVLRPCMARVRYMMKAHIDSTDKAINQTRERSFFVLRPLDLKSNSNVVQGPVSLLVQKPLGCFCCRRGTISCSVNLDKNGYVPGETLHIDVEINNNSKIEIETSNVTFEQHIKLSAQGNVKNITACIFSISGALIKPGDSGMYHDVIHIPPLPPSGLDGCKLIDIDYVIHVCIEPSGMYDSIDVDVPVIIGTEPLAGSFREATQGKFSVETCYASFDYTSGDIEEHSDDNGFENEYKCVYKYHKTVNVTKLPCIER